MKIKTVPLFGALALMACSAQPDRGPTNQATASEPASTRALREASTGMHSGMRIRYTGNPDTDFLQAMIPHHQGAIDMARVELQHGRDPAVRALAQQIVEAQAAEIKQMRAWLEERGVVADSSNHGER